MFGEGTQANQPQEPAPENLSLNSERLCLNSNNLCPNSSPRTSSPFDPTLFHHLAPLCPTSPSTSFDTVFFPDTPTPPAPIGEADLALPTSLESRETLSETPGPSDNLAEGIAMATLAEEEKKLKGVLRKIDSKIDSNPPNILTEEEMIPDYKSKQVELVALLEDLNMGVGEICEDYEAQLGITKINAWKESLATTKTKLFKYRQDVAAEIKN